MLSDVDTLDEERIEGSAIFRAIKSYGKICDAYPNLCCILCERAEFFDIKRSVRPLETSCCKYGGSVLQNSPT